MKKGRHEQPEGVEKCPVRILTGTSWQAGHANVVREVHLEVHFNGRKMVTIACMGSHPEELGVGWLRGEGVIGSAREIASVEISRDGLSVDVKTIPGFTGPLNDGGTIISSSGGRSVGHESKGLNGKNGILGNQPMGAEEAERAVRSAAALECLVVDTEAITADRIFMLMDNMIAAASIHELSRGTHGAALADRSAIFVTREDIGRHNCLDMLSGYTLLHEINGADKILLRTGRVSSEIVHKVWRMGIPVVLSLSVPTALAVSLAWQAGITLVGAIRAPSLTVYTHGNRIRES